MKKPELRIDVVAERFNRFAEVRWYRRVIAVVWLDRYTITDAWPKATDDEPLPEVLRDWGEVLVRARALLR